MNDIDPAAVMAAHAEWRGGGMDVEARIVGACLQCGDRWPCESYRLAEALAVEQEKTEKYIDIAVKWQKRAILKGWKSIP